MSKTKKQPQDENRFTKILDDAGRALRGAGDYAFLETLPPKVVNDGNHVPFPYGAQPESRTGWK